MQVGLPNTCQGSIFLKEESVSPPLRSSRLELLQFSMWHTLVVMPVEMVSQYQDTNTNVHNSTLNKRVCGVECGCCCCHSPACVRSSTCACCRCSEQSRSIAQHHTRVCAGWSAHQSQSRKWWVPCTSTGTTSEDAAARVTIINTLSEATVAVT